MTLLRGRTSLICYIALLVAPCVHRENARLSFPLFLLEQVAAWGVQKQLRLDTLLLSFFSLLFGRRQAGETLVLDSVGRL